MTARWLERWLDARGDATIDEAAFATTMLQALGGRYHRHALEALRDLAEAAPERGLRAQAR